MTNPREENALLTLTLVAKSGYGSTEKHAVSPQCWQAICAITGCTNPDTIEAICLVLAERARQRTAEGFTTAHDDNHTDGALAAASAEYVLHASFTDERDTFPPGKPSDIWPWEKDWWKPTDPRSDMVKSVALGLAEVERLIRAEVAA